ncbi:MULTISPECIES: hypothetical protein [unclassified Nocardia]|uniref:hypothetical protein n=1 Tax=unclassified Nocardia TaxID=2637762 RepID=UPI0033AB744E
MSNIERRPERPRRKPSAELSTNPVRAIAEAGAELERKVATAKQAVRTDMRIKERLAEAEIAQDRIDRGR